MEWYEELDYEENPFKDNEDTELIGYEDLVNDVLYRIASGNIVCVEGKSGAGKTAILKAAVNKFKGNDKVVYLDGQQLENGLNIEHVLKKRSGFMKSLFNKKPKNMILLLDEVQKISEKNCERIKYYFDNNFIKSAVFTSSDFKKSSFTDSLRERISKTLQLRELTEDEATDIVQSRLGNDEIIPEEVIKEVFNKSDRNMKRFLNTCDGLCSFAFKNNGRKVLPEHLKEFFEDEEVEGIEVEEPEVEEPEREINKNVSLRKGAYKKSSSKSKTGVKKSSVKSKSNAKTEKGSEDPKLAVEEPVTVAISDDFKPEKKEVKMEDEVKDEEIDIDDELKKLKKANELDEEDELVAEDYEEDYDDFKEVDDEDDEESRKVVNDENAEKYY